jgi:hypothetical protein
MERVQRRDTSISAVRHHRDQAAAGARAAAAPPSPVYLLDQPSRRGVPPDARSGGRPRTAPFQFDTKRCRLDWRLLHGIDLDRLVRDITHAGTCAH